MNSIIFLITILLFVTNSLHADKDLTPENTSTLILYIENDFFGGTDEHYTSALKLSWISADLRTDGKGLPFLSRWLIDLVPGINRRDFLHNWSFSLGQSIYTPENVQTESLIANDRPYAGWTYLSLGMHSKNFYLLNSLELTLGIVGPASLAEETQKTIHDWIGDDEPSGWDNQLDNEPGFLLALERHWRLIRHAVTRSSAYDLIAHAGGALGNVYTFANTGLEARIGYNLPVDFGTSLIGPGGATIEPVGMGDPRLGPEKFALSFFAGFEARAIARNIFLDGNTFEESHSVDKKNFVADLYAGISLVYRRFSLTYTHVYRTEEFEGQDHGQYFGSINLALVY